jgi:DNA gyrase subunit A
VSEIRVAGRATQGVKLINLKEKDSIAAVAKVNKSEVKEEQAETVTEEAEIITEEKNDENITQ